VSVSELKRMKGLEAENAKNSGADIKLARRFSASPTRRSAFFNIRRDISRVGNRYPVDGENAVYSLWTSDQIWIRLPQRRLAQHHAANNADAEHVQPTVHEIEQVRVHKR
jgi:hypothetical protein